MHRPGHFSPSARSVPRLLHGPSSLDGGGGMAPCRDHGWGVVCGGEMGVNTVYIEKLRVVTDPAVEPSALPGRPRRVLLTHGHADHARYASALRGKGAWVHAPRLCAWMLEDPRLNHMATTGWAGPVPEWMITRYFLGPGVRVDFHVDPGMVLPGVTAMAAPGHTPGSLVYLVETAAGVVAVAGDTVYGYSYLEATPILYHTDTLAWLDTLSRLRETGVDLLVPGHGDPVEGSREARRLVERNIEKIEEMLGLVHSLLPRGEPVTGDEAAAAVAEATGYARSRRAYSILGPTVRALLMALTRRGQAELVTRSGVPAWRRA